jgi:hypothetical protein
MNSQDVAVGMRVKVTQLNTTDGLCVADKHISVRRIGVTGIVRGHVPGHGGDVWWITHDDGQIGAYSLTEFENKD